MSDATRPGSATRCPHCGGDISSVTHGTPPEEVMALLPTPKGVTVAQEGGGLVIRRRWFNHQVWFLLLFCLFWDGFLVVWYANGIAAMARGESEALVMLLFPLLHVAAGIGISWWTLATLLNTTEIRLRSGMLEVAHGPLPWPTPDRLPTASLDQLYAVLKRGNKGRVSYELHARQKGGVSHKLLGQLPSADLARYLEQRVESYLELADRPVAEELPR